MKKAKKAKKASPKKRSESLRAQIDRLANVIQHEVRPQPAHGEKNIADTAIRLLRVQANPETVHVSLTPREARQTVFALLRLGERIAPASHAENSTMEFIKALAEKIDTVLMKAEGNGQELMGVSLAK